MWPLDLRLPDLPHHELIILLLFTYYSVPNILRSGIGQTIKITKLHLFKQMTLERVGKNKSCRTPGQRPSGDSPDRGEGVKLPRIGTSYIKGEAKESLTQ